MSKNIRLSYDGASISGDHRHAETIMKSLGISYREATAHSVAACWIFSDCKNIPDNLPDYLTVLPDDGL